MKKDTLLRKQAARGFRSLSQEGWLRDRMFCILAGGKRAFDQVMLEMGKMFAETIMLMDREETTGPEYHPTDSDIKKWASQPGSVYIGDQKVKVQHPRVRDVLHGREVPLASYLKLKDPAQFSEEILGQILSRLVGIGAEVRRDGRGRGRGVWGFREYSVAQGGGDHEPEAAGVL